MKKYRIRRKIPQTQTVIIIVLASLLILTLAFIIVGNVLYGRSDIENEIISKKNQHTITTDLKNVPQDVNASALILSGTTGQSSLNSAAAKADDDGIDMLSVCLNDRTGKLTYRSSLSASHTDITSLNDSISLGSVMSAVSSRGLNASALLFVRSCEEEGGEALSLAGEEAALALEALEAGANELIFRLTEFQTGYTESVLRVINLVRNSAQNAVIGVSLPPDALSDANVSVALEPLLNDVDFFCLEPSENKDFTIEELSSSVISCRMAILRYKVRVLIPYRDEVWRSAAKSLMDELAINGKMYVEY